MEKIASIFFCAALAAVAALSTGCENTLETIKVSGDDEIMMNALMDAGEDFHIVYLSHGLGTEFRPYASKGPVRCYVNGELATTAEPSPYYDLYFCKAYVFKAGFKAGDKVRLETEEGVSAEVRVPQSPEILGVDTTYFENGEDRLRSILSLRTRLQDVPDDENYYSFNVRAEIYRGESFRDTTRNRAALYTDNEPLLKEYSSGKDDSKTFFDDYVKNKYHLFSDKSFAGKSYVMNVGIYPYDCLWGYYYEDKGNYTTYSKTGACIIVQVSSLSAETYRYIKASESSDFWHFEPVIFPQNVSGGLGFVSVANSAVWKIRLPDKMAPDPFYY